METTPCRSSYYRYELPSRELLSLGWSVWRKRLLVEGLDRRLYGWDGPAKMPGSRGPEPNHLRGGPAAKVVVARHVIDPSGVEADSAEMYADATQRGQHVFVDLDDDVWQLPEWNPATIYYTGEALEVVTRNLDAASGVLVSTPALAEQVRKRTTSPVYVCPNGIDPSPYRVTGEHDPLRVGWLGMTDWRIRDLAMIGEALADALRGRAVEFWQLGAAPDRLPVRDALPDDFPVKVVERPWVSMSQLPDALAQIDLAIVPMEDIPVNRSRSATTGLALAAAGVPFIASPRPAYVEFGACLLAETADDWNDHLSLMLDSASFRQVMREKALARLAAYRPRTVCRAWHDTFRAHIRGKVKV